MKRRGEAGGRKKILAEAKFFEVDVVGGEGLGVVVVCCFVVGGGFCEISAEISNEFSVGIFDKPSFGTSDKFSIFTEFPIFDKFSI
jgi:hypothetical protein